MNIKNTAYITVILSFLSLHISAVTSQAEEPPSDNTAKKEWVTTTIKPTRGYNFTDYTVRPDINFSFGGESFKPDHPSLSKADDIWVPVEHIMNRMRVMFLKTGDDTFGVIRDDGTPLELKSGGQNVLLNKAPYFILPQPPAIYEGVMMISLKSLSRLLDITCVYDPKTNTVELGGEKHGETEFFTLPEPVVEKKAQGLPPAPPPTRIPVDIVEEGLPRQYMRDIDTHVDMSGSYLGDESSHDRTRQVQWNPSGRIYDYTVGGQFKMKDFRTTEKQAFKEDGEFLSVSSHDLLAKMFDNYISIPTLRSQSQPYFGGEITHYHNPFSTTVSYGTTSTTVAGPANIGSVRYLGKLATVRGAYASPSNSFKTNEILTFWENSAEHQSQSSTTRFPREDIAFITDNRLDVYKGLKLNYALGLSSFVPDNRVNARYFDSDWKLGGEFNKDLYTYGVYYEHVGAQYASVGIPENYEDYEAWDFSTGYRFTKNWNSSVTARLSKNNVERNPRVPTNFTKNLTVSSGLGLPWQQSINVSWTLDETIARGGDADMVGNRYQDYRVDYSKEWKSLSAQLSYDHYNLDVFSTGTGGSVTDAATMSLFNTYPEINNSYIRFLQTYRKTKTIAAASYTTETEDTDVGGRLNITKYLSASADWRVSYTLREAFTDTATMALSAGVEFKSSPVTVFNFDFTLSGWDLYNRKTQIPKQYQVIFRGRHVFDYFSSDKWASVKVRVFKDVNGSGKYDPGEPGIDKVRVYISKGRARLTNINGYAYIDKVVPGERLVKIDLSTLPLDYVARGLSVKPIVLKSLKTEYVDFPIVKTGTIKGRVYVDKNRNGVYDKLIDEGLPNIRVYLDPEGKDTLTLSDGSYYFDYTYPGDYNVCIDPQSISSGLTLKSPAKIPVSLHENEKIEDNDFNLAAREIEIQYVGGE